MFEDAEVIRLMSTCGYRIRWVHNGHEKQQNFNSYEGMLNSSLFGKLPVVLQQQVRVHHERGSPAWGVDQYPADLASRS